MRSAITLFNGGDDAKFVGWAPVPARIHLEDTGNAAGLLGLTLRNRQAGTGGRLRFFEKYTGQGATELPLNVPSSGEPVEFYLAGEYKHPSTDADDAVVEVVGEQGQLIGTHSFMVRVRKDAQSLSRAERDRVVNAFATLNDHGMGKFADFRSIHRELATLEAHGRPGFLPWHRCLLLDLERELQKIDPRVALPYWRFDQPAPAIFTQDFLGVAGAGGKLRFADSNPLKGWVTDGALGLKRSTFFNTQSSGASTQQGLPVRTELDTLALGEPGGLYATLITLEGNPHGRAHRSFEGPIDTIDTAARDPLFFLLHANVDRLWAKWQSVKRRFDPSADNSYSLQGEGRRDDDVLDRIGHCALDSMWPWNGDAQFPRPDSAPGGELASSVMTEAPGPSPTVADMVDYQGVHSATHRLGFDYDDVPFRF
jgi:tyrosinase